MSSLIEIDFYPARNALRKFGFLAGVGFGLAAWLAWNERLVFAFGLGDWRMGLTCALGALGALAVVFACLWPPGNRPIYVGLSLLGFPIGLVVSYVILGALFYLVITPVGFFFRGIGRDPMRRRFEPDTETFWVDIESEKPSESYFKQF